MDWKQIAEQMYFEYGKNWTELANKLQGEFPQKTWYQARNTIRDYIRRLPQYKDEHKDAEIPDKSSLEYCKDGSIVSEKFIILKDGVNMTPEYILTAHGLKTSEWEVISYKNNFWNTQLKGGTKQISYQSKLTAKPKAGGLDLEEIDKHFAELDRKHFTPPKYVPRKQGNVMAEVNIADLHLGKLCWRGDTPENFDYKIARDMYYNIINEIAQKIKGKPMDYITFVWANDFFNSDTVDKTTTGGTPQDTDIREKKLFDVGTEMLVRGIEMFRKIVKVPIHTFYTPSNHDELSGYHALKYIEAYFRKDKLVEVDTSAYPRKYQLYGNTLLGYTHGAKENDKHSYEKASRLASLMPNEAHLLWGQSLYHEMHAAHLHSEQVYQEINGVIVRRISSPTASDSWHTESGYIGAVRKAQTFIYDKERGLTDIINTPVA